MAKGRKPTKLHPSQELTTRADVLAMIERVVVDLLDRRYVKLATKDAQTASK